MTQTDDNDSQKAQTDKMINIDSNEAQTVIKDDKNANLESAQNKKVNNKDKKVKCAVKVVENTAIIVSDNDSKKTVKNESNTLLKSVDKKDKNGLKCEDKILRDKNDSAASKTSKLLSFYGAKHPKTVTKLDENTPKLDVKNKLGCKTVDLPNSKRVTEETSLPKRSLGVINLSDRNGQKSFAVKTLSDGFDNRGKVTKNGPAEVENQVVNIKKKFQPKKLPLTDNKELNEVFNRIKEKKRKQEERKKDNDKDNNLLEIEKDAKKKGEENDTNVELVTNSSEDKDKNKEVKDKNDGKEKVSFLRIMFENKGKDNSNKNQSTVPVQRTRRRRKKEEIDVSLKNQRSIREFLPKLQKGDKEDQTYGKRKFEDNDIFKIGSPKTPKSRRTGT